MIIEFDKFNRYERPILTLANPNRQEIGQLGSYIDLNVTLNFNAVSEISFEYPELCENGEKSNLYDQIKPKKVIRTEQLGYFIITKCDETKDGVVNKLNITATSAEIELNYRKINLFDGTYKFYDPLNPDDSLLGKLVSAVPLWSIGYVSDDLLNKYRTFDIPDSTIYGFLMNEVENSYECIFDFDTYNRVINAYSPNDIVKPTDIFVSYDNLIKELDVEENSDGIITCMSCYGGGNLSIADVNPLGSSIIYNFDYFKNQMSSSLVNALNRWENLFNQNQPAYKEYLVTLQSQNAELIKLNGEKVDLEGELAAAKEVQAAKIQQGITNDTSYQAVFSQITELEGKIEDITEKITQQESRISATKSQLTRINQLLSFDNRSVFSEDNVLELENYKYESTYQDDSFIQTSQMSLVEIQEMSQSLYDQCINVLNKSSVPRYTITVDSVNFVHLPEFAPLLNTIEQENTDEIMKQLLGCSFNLEVQNEEYIQPILLNLSLNYDDPTDFSMTFANRYRLDNSFWTFDDLYGEGAKTSSSISFDISGLKDWESYQNDLVDFANSSLDMTRNQLVNDSRNIEMQFDSTGLIAKKRNESTGDFYGEQVWLTYNVLAFTKDKFATVETAIGRIPLPTGGYGYGLNAGVLIGKAIFGSSMTLANENNSLVMDAKGFTMTTNNQSGRIILSPSDGIKIQGNQGSASNPSFKDKFYVDNQGNLNMEGNLVANSGSIGGISIEDDGLYFSNGDYMRKDGYGKISLMSYTPYSATFNGNIYARNLLDTVNSDKITNGAVTGSKLGAYAVTSGKLGNGAVTTSKLGNGSVTAAKLDRLSVDQLYASKAEFDNLKARVISTDSYGRISGYDIYTDNIVYTDQRQSSRLRFRHAKVVTGIYWTSQKVEFTNIYYVAYAEPTIV